MDINIDFKKIVGILPENVYWLDRNNVFLGCNNLQAAQLGISPSEVKGKTIYDFLEKKNADLIIKNNELVINTGKTHIFEETFTERNGTETIFLSRKAPLFDDNDKVIGIIGVSTDITEYKKTEQSNIEFLKKISQEVSGSDLTKEKTVMAYTKWIKNYLENIIALMPGNIYWKDKNGVILGCNNNMAKYFGYKLRDELVGLTDFDLLDKAQAEAVRNTDNRVMKLMEMETIEEISKLPEQQTRTFLSKKEPLKDEKGKGIGILGVSIDITERKKAEEELKQAKEKAELANKSKSDFLLNMRHDMRTSLSGIQGFSELIKSETHEPKIREYADDLVASCRALTHFHNQILHAIHVYSGDVPAYRSKFDLHGRLKQLIDLNLAKAKEKKLKLTLHYDKKIPKYLVGDCKRLTIIAQELITNALKYTHTGSIAVDANLDRKKDNNYIIKFVVKDTGIGIADDKLEEIFTRFSRLTPAYEGKYEGLGLGLSVAKQFVSDIGGEIYVESKSRKGSTFTCYLPFAEALSRDHIGIDDEIDLSLLAGQTDFASKNISALSASTKQQQQGKEGSVAKRGNNILLIEDDTLCAKAAHDMLASLGHSVDKVKSGEEALKRVKNISYDIVFIDIGLPGIDGNEVTRKIRMAEKATDEHVPIIALTAHVGVEDKQNCVDAGMDAVLLKPITREKATDIINAFAPKFVLRSDEPKKSKDKKTKAAVIDLEHIKNELHYNKTVFKEMLKIAKEAVTRDLKEFKELHKQKKWQRLEYVTHRMAGVSAYCGALRLGDLCHKLEDDLKGDKKELLVNELSKKVITECERLQAEIKKIFKNNA